MAGDLVAYKIIFHAFLRLSNYYIVLHYNGPPAWGLGEGITHSKKKKTFLRNVTQGI